MSRNRPQMTDWSLDVAILSLVVAIVALFISRQAFKVETEPALLLDFKFNTPLELAVPLPTWRLFLMPGESHCIDMPKVLPIHTKDGADWQSPLPMIVFECSLTNHGRSPVLNVLIEFSVQFGADQDVSLSAPSESVRVEVGGLAPKESHRFVIRNACDQYVRINAPEVAMVETPSKRDAFKTRLFTTGRTRTMSGTVLRPSPLTPASEIPMVTIED